MEIARPEWFVPRLITRWRTRAHLNHSATAVFQNLGLLDSKEYDPLHSATYYADKLFELRKIIETNKITAVFWLDKSARPIYWVYEGLAKELPEAVKVEHRFICPRPGELCIDLDHSIPVPYRLPHGSVLVVDETDRTGASLFCALSTVKYFFPDRKIFCHSLAIEPKWRGTKKDTEAFVGVTESRSPSLEQAVPCPSSQSRSFRKSMVELGRAIGICIKVGLITPDVWRCTPDVRNSDLHDHNQKLISDNSAE